MTPALGRLQSAFGLSPHATAALLAAAAPAVNGELGETVREILGLVWSPDLVDTLLEPAHGRAPRGLWAGLVGAGLVRAGEADAAVDVEADVVAFLQGDGALPAGLQVAVTWHPGGWMAGAVAHLRKEPRADRPATLAPRVVLVGGEPPAAAALADAVGRRLLLVDPARLPEHERGAALAAAGRHARLNGGLLGLDVRATGTEPALSGFLSAWDHPVVLLAAASGVCGAPTAEVLEVRS